MYQNLQIEQAIFSEFLEPMQHPWNRIKISYILLAKKEKNKNAFQ